MNFGPRTFRPGKKFRYDFRPGQKNLPEIRTELKETRRISHYKKHSAEQYVVVPSNTTLIKKC
jgi:hypothetical protein